MRTKLRRTFIVLAVLTAAVLAGTAAGAVLTARVGSQTERQHFITEGEAWATGNAFWTDVPGASRRVIIGPGNGRRLLDVRYTAESACTGPDAVGYCSVRIIVQYPSGFRQELNPASATDFAFDSVAIDGDDQWEAHAIERTSNWLRAGTYRVRVQAAVVAGASEIRLDDWHLAVEVIRP